VTLAGNDGVDGLFLHAAKLGCLAYYPLQLRGRVRLP
jgi:hypothetical protein